MGYSTQADIENKRIPQATLIELTDDAGTGSVDADIVAGAIADADALIESYLEPAGYPVPLAAVPTLISRLSADIAAFYLYGRRPEFETPKRIEAGHDSGIRLLEKLQAGQVTFGSQADDVTGDQGGVQVVQAGDRIFTRASLENY